MTGPYLQGAHRGGGSDKQKIAFVIQTLCGKHSKCTMGEEGMDRLTRRERPWNLTRKEDG